MVTSEKQMKKSSKILLATLIIIVPFIIIYIVFVAPFIKETIEADKRREMAYIFSTKNDMSTLSITAGMIYSQEGTFKSLNCEHELTKDLCKRIKEKTGSEIIIHTSDNEFCAYVKLPKINYYNPEKIICISNYKDSADIITITTKTSEYCNGKIFTCPR